MSKHKGKCPTCKSTVCEDCGACHNKNCDDYTDTCSYDPHAQWSVDISIDARVDTRNIA